jgi:predicted type IV restriction endonuclease
MDSREFMENHTREFYDIERQEEVLTEDQKRMRDQADYLFMKDGPVKEFMTEKLGKELAYDDFDQSKMNFH